jgi:hypothetical protein
VLKALQTRHLLFTVQDPQVGRGLSIAGWDGALRPAVGDYLMVADANIGYRKVNPLVQQSVDYSVEFDSNRGAAGLQVGQQPQATLALRYTNRSQGPAECEAGSALDYSYAEMMRGCYWDYVRVYVPLGSRLLAIQGGDAAAQVSAEAGKTVFSTLLVVAPGQTRELVLQYELPSSLQTLPGSDQDGTLAATSAGASYSLLVQKEAGTVAVPYRVSVSEPGWQLSPTRSTLMEAHDGQEVTFSLATDTQLSWVDTSGRGKRTIVPIVALAGLGLLLIGLGLWVRERGRVSPEV